MATSPPVFTMIANPASFTLSRGYNNRSEPARTRPRQDVIVRVVPNGRLGWVALMLADSSYQGPGLIATNYQYVSFLGGSGVHPPGWTMIIRFTTLPKSVPLGLHRCVLTGSPMNSTNTVPVKVALNVTIVDP